jgi:hypothetical protein
MARRTVKKILGTYGDDRSSECCRLFRGNRQNRWARVHKIALVGRKVYGSAFRNSEARPSVM